MKTNFRSKVFSWAYEIDRVTGKQFAVCLAKAWALYRLKKAMKQGIVSFAYEKADGTLRKAKGTLKEVRNLIKGTGKDKVNAFPYFDTEVHAFRSFKIENLVTIY